MKKITIELTPRQAAGVTKALMKVRKEDLGMLFVPATDVLRTIQAVTSKAGGKTWEAYTKAYYGVEK